MYLSKGKDFEFHFEGNVNFFPSFFRIPPALLRIGNPFLFPYKYPSFHPAQGFFFGDSGMEILLVFLSYFGRTKRENWGKLLEASLLVSQD